MSIVLDPSGIQISVQLRVRGETYPLWIGGAVQNDSTIYYSGGNSNLLFKDIPIVTSVQIDYGIGLVGSIAVEVAANYELGLKLLESALFSIGAIIDVQVGYPKNSQFLPWFSAQTAQPTVNINPDDGLQATLTGQGGGFAAIRGRSSEDFTGTYRSIIESIANQESNKWNIDIPDQGAKDDPLYVNRDRISQGNRTDWMFVQYLCRMANYDCWLMPDQNERGTTLLKVARRSDTFSGSPDHRTFVCRGQCDFINTFPILSFESAGEGIWLPVREIRTADIDIRTRESDPEISVRPEDTDISAMPGDTIAGAGAVESDGTVVAVEPVPRDKRGTGRRIVAPAHAPESPREVVNSMAVEARQHGGLNATFTAIGMPDIFPGEVVKLIGLGIFSGNYVVQSISHSVQPGEWTMTVTLLGDGVSSDGVETGISRTMERYNQSSTDEEPESSGGGRRTVEPESVE